MVSGNPDSGLFNSSIAKGLRVLEVFQNGRHSLSLSQIASLTGLEKSGVQRFTATLVKLGYLRKDPVNRQYRLSPRVLRFGASYTQTSPLIEKATPYLLQWNRQQDQTVNLCELDGTDVIIVARVRARQVVSPGVVVGSALSWHSSAAGQAIVAHLPEPDQIDIVKRTDLLPHTSRTITDRAALTKRLARVDKDGYAFCHAESFDEDISIGAPVFDTSGRVIASVSTALLDTQWAVEKAREKFAPLVRELATTISSASQAPRNVGKRNIPSRGRSTA